MIAVTSERSDGSIGLDDDMLNKHSSELVGVRLVSLAVVTQDCKTGGTCKHGVSLATMTGS